MGVKSHTSSEVKLVVKKQKDQQSMFWLFLSGLKVSYQFWVDLLNTTARNPVIAS